VSAAAPIADSELEALFAPLTPFAVLILAVSGGADSVAMMHLVARWSARHPDASRKLVVATVDHGLRPESRREAQWVADAAGAIGLASELLTWEGAKPATGLQDAARNERYRLLADLAWRRAGSGPVAIVTAHTEDDQAETVLMRLARGSGLDGLTGMSVSRIIGPSGHCQLVRPLLRVAGARLKATLKDRKLGWIEDPSNECDRFERVRLRKAQSLLAALGLTNDKIALSAKRLERARAALEAATGALQTAAGLDVHGGMFASLDARVLAGAAEEVRVRLMARLISAFGGQDAPARLARLESLVARLSEAAFEAATLGGCIVTRHADEIWVFREPGRAGLPEIALAPGGVAVWDRRFRVEVAPELGATVIVRALGGAGFAKLRQQCKGAEGLPPARAAATLPSFWQDGALLAVPQLAAVPFAPAASVEGRHCSAEFLW
jgi:tRNA(Ile)-lysidine synthase